VRRLASTSLFVLGYWLMSCLDGNVAFVPSVASFCAASALIVRGPLAEALSDS
jgi:hypothetical protein